MLSPIGKGSEGSVPSIGQLYKSMNPLPICDQYCEKCENFTSGLTCRQMKTEQLSAQVS